MRHPSLLFAAMTMNRPDYLSLWSTLPADSSVDEVIRNFFIRQPALWIDMPLSHASRTDQQTAARNVRLQADSQTAARSVRLQADQQTPITVASPDGRIKFELDLRSGKRLAYRVTMNGHPVITRSRLGIAVDGVNLGDGAAIATVERTHADERYRTRGVHAIATNRYNGAAIRVSHEHSGTPYAIELRVFDDGVAFRYVVPGGAAAQRTPEEATVFNLPAESTVWYHDLDGHYEGVHEQKDIEDVQEGEWAAPPLTARLPDGLGYAAITEAALANYPGMALQAVPRGGFAARLGHAVPASYPYRLRYPALDVMRLGQPAVIGGTLTTPWRAVLIGSDLNTLVNSDIITNLSPPPDPALFPQGLDTPWVKPGRAVWRYLDGGDNTFDGIKHFSELAGTLGFEYQVVEGLWRRWTDAQLRELVSFSNERHVGILLWVHSRDLRDAAARRALFDKLHALGVAGVKVDFFDHEAKEVIDLYHDILRDAAAKHLICDFHGANKPAGESRTWPNELTREGVYGLEHRAQAWATHNTTIPFTRYLAGPGDYTPTVFGDRRRETSWPHQIATAAVFTSPLLVYGGHPQSLLDNPAVDVIKALPSTWDETIVLPGSRIGETAIFARRKGSDWFIAALNGRAARTLTVDLTFLGPATYRGMFVRDDPDNAAAERIERVNLTRHRVLAITMRPGGGFIARLVPVKVARREVSGGARRQGFSR
jgi:alpha-glucosidase